MTTVLKYLFVLLPLCVLGQDKGAAPLANELVINGGFEDVDPRIPSMDGIGLASGWEHVTLGLPDLFSKQASTKTVGIPENLYGTLEPVEGDHYVGLFAWKDDVRRNWGGGQEDPFRPGWNVYSEYIQSELKQPLEEGVEYEVSFRIALSGNSDRAVSGIGAYLSPAALHYDHRRFLEEKPQVSVSRILDERSTWVEVSGRFEADGGERFIVIGTWPYAGFETKNCTVGADNQYAYYYLDAISVTPVSAE